MPKTQLWLPDKPPVVGLRVAYELNKTLPFSSLGFSIFDGFWY
ncbi:MAG: hypothetical protein AAFQ01_01275 [Bacteroidota bacterium]